MPADPHDLPFLAGGGDATRLIAAVDWSAHPLGATRSLADGLRTALSLVVNSPELMILLVGPLPHLLLQRRLRPAARPARSPGRWVRASTASGPTRSTRRCRSSTPPAPARSRASSTCRGSSTPTAARADCWFSFSYSRILGADGAVAGFFIFTNETTARVRADEELRKSRAKLAEALDDVRALNDDLERRVEERTAERDRLWDASPDLLVIVDFDGVFRRANPAWATILGIAPDEVVGRTPWDFIHPDDRAITEARGDPEPDRRAAQFREPLPPPRRQLPLDRLGLRAGRRR